jgi:hypothetical protein
MPRVESSKTVRPFLVASLVGCLGLFLPPAQASAQTCEDSCSSDYSSCSSGCDNQYNSCWYSSYGDNYCDQDRQSCYSSCDSQYNSCTSSCTTTGGGGGGSTTTSDGHIWCDGWKGQGDCALNHLGVAAGAEFRRLRGSGGYAGQTFLTTNPAEFNGFGRFQTPDGNVGNISTSPEAGQVPLYRWSTTKGFYYSTYYTSHGSDYVYGGIAGYVWPAGSTQGFPLYQYYSNAYGHFYTNYRNDIACQPATSWSFQGEMARVNWPAPAVQANRVCYNNQVLGPFPPNCDPFDAVRCQAIGGFFNNQNCGCF